VRAMPARALLTSVVRVQQAVVACAGPLSSKASTILRAARVPSEACYRSAMTCVLRTWLCNPAVVTVEECNSGGARRVHLRVDTGPRKIIIDIVCHRPASSLPPATGKCQVIVSMCSPSPSPPFRHTHARVYHLCAYLIFPAPRVCPQRGVRDMGKLLCM
jgi:hypothetical protein